MLKRPKSAVLLSLPYNFQNKQQAIDIKEKVKRSLLTFQTQQSLDIDLYSDKKQLSYRSYIDNGPSLLNKSSQHYSLVQPTLRTVRSQKSLQNSRALSSLPTPKTHSKKNSMQICTGLQNYQRLKPCKTIKQKSVKNLSTHIQTAQKQSKFIDRIFQNLSPRKDIPDIKKSFKLFKRNKLFHKENVIEIKGKSVQLIEYSNKINSLFNEQIPYKGTVFQPTLQRKGLQLLRKSKAYLSVKN